MFYINPKVNTLFFVITTGLLINKILHMTMLSLPNNPTLLSKISLPVPCRHALYVERKTIQFPEH